MEKITINAHASVKITSSKTVYFDPYLIEEAMHDADVIFISHSHYDHFSPEAIEKIVKQTTVFVAPKSMKEEMTDYSDHEIVFVEPEQKYETVGIHFSTVAAYNIAKTFHPRHNEWVGYVVNLDKKVYFAGDTELTPEIRNVHCDVAILPIGGKYTMDARDAAELVNFLRPKVAIPMHYGSIIGSKEDADLFESLIDTNIEVRKLI